MELNAKQAAKSKHKHSQHLKRVHGGRGRGRTGPAGLYTHGPDLDSNYDRYNSSDEETEQASGELVRQSEGADVEQLLAESQQFYAQAHFRYRSFTDTIHTEPPPVNVAALEQELALQAEPLIQALALLPLSELLGIDQEYIQACDPANDIFGVTDSEGKHRAEQQQQQAAVQLQQQQAMPKLPRPQQQQQEQQQPEHKSAAPQTLPGGSRSAVPTSTSKPLPAAAVAPLPSPVVPAAATAAASRHPPALDDNDDDEVLQQLLTGSTAQQRIPEASKAQQAAAWAGNRTRDSRPGVWEQSAASKPQPSAAAVGISEQDDELDELLGLCGGTLQPASTQAKPAMQPAATSSTKKQSLEDWLDGF